MKLGQLRSKLVNFGLELQLPGTVKLALGPSVSRDENRLRLVCQIPDCGYQLGPHPQDLSSGTSAHLPSELLASPGVCLDQLGIRVPPNMYQAVIQIRQLAG